MQKTIDRINNKIDLLNKLKGSKKSELSVLLVMDTVFVVYNLGFIGRFEDKDGKALNDFLEYHDVSLSSYDIDAIAFKDEDMNGKDNWCFDSEDFLDSFVELNALNNITKDIVHDMKVQSDSSLGLQMVDELIDKKIRIHEEVPVTNNISLSNEFTIKSLDINKYIEETINMYPLLIKDVTFGFHKSDETHYNKHINVTEDLYEKFLRLIPKGREKVTEFKRVKALSEYYEGFKKLREFLYNNDYTSKDIEEILTHRRIVTSRLKSKINQTAISYGLNQTEKHKLYSNVFYTVNNKCGLGNLNEEVNRDNASPEKQKDLEWIEEVLMMALNAIKTIVPKELFQDTFLMYILTLDVKNRKAPTALPWFIKQIGE